MNNPLTGIFLGALLALTALPLSAATYPPPAAAKPLTTISANTTAAPVAQTLADPALLCSPDNPAPKGAPAAIVGDALAKLATTKRTNGNWFVTFTNRQPMPLAVMTDVPPKLLSYYPPAPGTPATQPAVLVYQAGSTVLTDGTGRIVIVERALVFDPAASRPIGDALWAVRAATGTVPMAQPAWKWTEDKLVVKNPFEQTIQEISLAPKAK